MAHLLKDKVVVITGGAGLLGTEFVARVAEQGAVAVIADCNQEAGLRVKEQLIAQNPDARIDFVLLDICSKQSVNESIEAISARYGKIDALVNNAYPRNKHYGRPVMEVDYEDFCDNVNRSLGGYFLTSQQFASYFIRQGYGNIVNIASVYGVIAPKFAIYEQTAMTMPVEYAVIKSGLIHLTRYFAKFFKGKNIRVNALSPGGILDAQPEVFVNAYRDQCINKGMLDKADIAGSLLFLLSDLSACINGQNLVVDDGFTI